MVATTTVPSKKGPKTTPRHNQTTSGVPRGLPLVSTARPSFSWIGCDCPGDGFIREGICHLTAKENLPPAQAAAAVVMKEKKHAALIRGQ